MASVKTITLPDGSSYDFKATYDIEGNNISETYINKNEKGAASGVAPLNSSGKIDESYLPSSGSSSGGSSDFVSESGSFVQFDYSKADVPFSSLKVKINAVQLGSGDPSPSNVREIIGYDSASAIVTGKNMAPQFVSGRSVSATTGNNSGTASDGTSINCATEEFIPVNFKATNYVVGCDATGLPATPSSQIFCYDANKTYLGQFVSSTTNPRDLSMNSTVNSSMPFNHEEVCFIKIRYFFAANSGNTWTQAMCDGAHFRMNPGGTLNDYVAYEAPDIYTSDFTSAGTVYGGELDVLNGKLTVTKKMYEFTSATTYTPTQSSGGFWYITQPRDNAKSSDPTIISNMYKSVAVSSATIVDQCIRVGTTVIVYDNRFTSSSAVASILSANPIQVLCNLEAPITYQLTPAEVKTLLGQNNVWSDAGEVELTVLPSGVRDYLNSLILVVTQNSSTGELTLS